MSDFDKPRTVSYCDGPAVAGVAEDARFTARWAAWVSKSGIRVGKYSSVTPPSETLGYKSHLYPNTKPKHLSIAFDHNGWMTIAIEKTETLIELKRFVGPNLTDIDTRSWSGQSPIMFNNWLLFFDLADPNEFDMVCFYLKDASPDTIFVRFDRDNYATEYELNYALPSELDYLISVDRYLGLQQIMLAKTKRGDDATLTSDVYGVRARNEADLHVALDSGDYFNRAVTLISPVTDEMDVSITLDSGEVLEVAKLDKSGHGEKVTFATTLDQGDYSSAA